MPSDHDSAGGAGKDGPISRIFNTCYRIRSKGGMNVYRTSDFTCTAKWNCIQIGRWSREEKEEDKTREAESKDEAYEAADSMKYEPENGRRRLD